MLKSVNIAKEYEASWGRTALPKRPVEGRVSITATGVAGDDHVDIDHGGVYFECSAYAREDLDWWEGRLGRELPDGSFGENLTFQEVTVGDMILGQYWRIGTVRFEVMGPSLPSAALAASLGDAALLDEMIDTDRPGVYLRPIVYSGGGDMAAGDRTEILWTPERELTVTVAEAWQACLGDETILRRILKIPGRSPLWDMLAERATANA